MLDTFIHKYLHVPYRLYVHTDQKTKSPRATVLLLHGIGNTSSSWDEVVERLPNDIRVISMDLLGFGGSPSPRWLKYDINVQARSVIATLLRLGIRQPLIVVGHSLGSLTAIEMTKRYPLIVKSLILCSPPLYSTDAKHARLPDQAKILQEFYRLVIKNSQRIINTAPVGTRFSLVGKIFKISRHNAAAYMAALESSIMHQTSLEDIMKLKKPVRIIHGAFDPVVIKANLNEAVRVNKKINLSVIIAGHEMIGAYIPAVTKSIKTAAGL